MVGYKTATQALTDLKAGEIDFFFTDTTGALGPVTRGEIRPLGVTTVRRSKAFAEIPTMQEAGIAEYDLSSWFAIFAPAKTSKSVRDKLRSALDEVVKRKETADYLESIGIDALPGSPELLMEKVRRQTALYRKLYEDGKLSAAD